jgi:hypothetical protein
MLAHAIVLLFALSLTACGGDTIGSMQDTGTTGESLDTGTTNPARQNDAMPATHPADSGGNHDAGTNPPDTGNPDTGTTGPHDSGSNTNPDTGTQGSPDTGTGDQDTGTQGSPDTGMQGNTPFGGACTMDQNCQAGFICRTFGQLGMVCTKMCTQPSDCPVGSQGQKCNQMNLCRP